MAVEVKINIFILASDISSRVILEPSQEPEKTEVEKTIEKMTWPYNQSPNSGLLPIFTLPADTAAVFT